MATKTRIATSVLLLALLAFPVGVRSQERLPDDDRDLRHGRRTFRFDTFGDEAFWGDTLKLHQSIQGEAFGGVGPGLSPLGALGLGLKVDVDALPRPLERALAQGKVDLDSPATTLALLRLN
ncbi:MAG: hypothetical protein JO332_01380, partial [Planctomycetaceae bacterium]|nr:hypothetical protein [Planctomycetaceae bacterium]